MMAMSLKEYAGYAGAIFSLVTAGHVLRIAWGWDLIIGPWDVPMGLSYAAAVVSGAMAYLGYTFQR